MAGVAGRWTAGEKPLWVIHVRSKPILGHQRAFQSASLTSTLVALEPWILQPLFLSPRTHRTVRVYNSGQRTFPHFPWTVSRLKPGDFTVLFSLSFLLFDWAFGVGRTVKSWTDFLILSFVWNSGKTRGGLFLFETELYWETGKTRNGALFLFMDLDWFVEEFCFFVWVL